MPILQKQEVTHETIESPYRISWVRLGKFVLPPLILILAVAIWFVYFYIPANIDSQNQNTFSPEIKTASPSAGKNGSVELANLLSNPKNYSGKDICVQAYYYQAFESSALLDSYKSQEKEIGKYSTWVVNETGENIIADNTGAEAVREIEACGLFETGKSYGHLGSYQNQLTLKKFTPKGESTLLFPFIPLE